LPSRSLSLCCFLTSVVHIIRFCWSGFMLLRTFQ
jgi:hypothetical protein